MTKGLIYLATGLTAVFLPWGFTPTQAQIAIKHSPKLSSATLMRMSALRSAYDRIQAFITFSPKADVGHIAEKYGLKLGTHAAARFTALVPTGKLAELAKDPGITAIDAGNRIKAMNDSVRYFTNADAVAKGEGLPQGYDGSGVIIGIVDNGFDFTHPAFRNADGHSRIASAWDQNAQGGNIPSYGYGTVYDSEESLAAARHDLSSDTHGTHVLGIAAGSAVGKYGGVAPKATLVIVSTNKTEQGIIDGVDYILKYAEDKGKPAVINVSYGTVLGFKDGKGNLPSMLDDLLAGQKGRALCIAGGNEGDRNSMLDGDKQARTFLQIPSYGRDNIFMQGEADHDYSVTLTLRDTVNGNTLLERTLSSSNPESIEVKAFGTDGQSLLTASVQKREGDDAPAFSANILYTKEESQAWTITVSSDGGRYLLGSEYGTLTSNGKADYSDGNNYHTIAATATGHQPIAVGAYVSRRTYDNMAGRHYDSGIMQGELYPKSGRGPTFDNRIKPDVGAPGAAVISAFNSFSAPYTAPASDKVWKTEADGRTYYWGVASGTSMATPAVTGIVALWLQAFPELTADDVKEAISASSKKDMQTGNTPNADFGYGKIDALAGMQYLQKTLSGIEGIDNGRAAAITYDPQRRAIYIAEGKPVILYTADGKAVAKGTGPVISLDKITPGFYIVKSGSDIKKILIQ